MKSHIYIYCDSSTIGDKSQISSIYYRNKKSFKMHIEIIDESNNNYGELINIIKNIEIILSLDNNLKKNYEIIIYNDSMYAIDTMNEFLSYVKKMRGIPSLYKYYLENGYALYEKNRRYYSFTKAVKRFKKIKVNDKNVVLSLMQIMNTNKITFKWINREKNEKADKLSKMK